MVKVFSPQVQRVAQALPQILYIGRHDAELRPALALVDGLAMVATTSVDEGLTQARQCKFDFIVFDQREPDLSSKHIGSLIQGLGYASKMVVVSPFANLSAYLKVPGLSAVLAAPIRPQHVLRVLGLCATRETFFRQKPPAVEAPAFAQAS